VSEPLVATAKVGGSRRSRWSAMSGLVLEFALIFGATMLLKQVLAAAVNASYPSPLWLPVIVFALQRGFAAGLAAAIIASALQFSAGLPPALLTEDMYAYIGRIAAEPVGWTCAAMLIGRMRSRQIRGTAELQEQLAERSQHCAAVADLCADLRLRTEMLERQIAANAHSSNADVAEAMSKLHHAAWDDFARCLTRFIVLMTGSADFAVYLLQDGTLKLAFQPIDAHRAGADMPIAREAPLFAAIVNEQRILSAVHPADGALLGGCGIMAGPLMDGKAPSRVIGMLALRGVSCDDCPDDIERRFSLTLSELSRLAGRLRLLDTWEAAGAMKSNRYRPAADEAPCHAVRAEAAALPALAEHKQQPTLQ
jgi:hypothetical protein